MPRAKGIGNTQAMTHKATLSIVQSATMYVYPSPILKTFRHSKGNFTMAFYSIDFHDFS